MRSVMMNQHILTLFIQLWIIINHITTVRDPRLMSSALASKKKEKKGKA